MHMISKRLFSRVALMAAMLALVIAGSIGYRAASFAADKVVVVFQTNWCASCREVTPVVREIAGQNGMDVVIIDMDKQDAPRLAKSHGLAVPNEDPPQVYYINKGRAALLFNGKGYKFGYPDTVRSTILRNLQQLN